MSTALLSRLSIAFRQYIAMTIQAQQPALSIGLPIASITGDTGPFTGIFRLAELSLVPRGTRPRGTRETSEPEDARKRTSVPVIYGDWQADRERWLLSLDGHGYVLSKCDREHLDSSAVDILCQVSLLDQETRAAVRRLH